MSRRASLTVKVHQMPYKFIIQNYRIGEEVKRNDKKTFEE